MARRGDAAAGAAAVLAALLLPRGAAPSPAPPPAALAWTGAAAVVPVAPDRIRLLRGVATVVASSPFVVETPLAALRGDGPARFRVEMLEVNGMGPRVKKGAVAGAAAESRMVRLAPDAEGRLTLTELDPGRFVLRILGGPDRVFVTEFEVREGEVTEITLWD